MAAKGVGISCMGLLRLYEGPSIHHCLDDNRISKFFYSTSSILYDEMRQNRNSVGKMDFYILDFLDLSTKLDFLLLGKVDVKLSGSEMRNLMLPMKTYLDQEAVLNKVYSKPRTISSNWTLKTCWAKFDSKFHLFLRYCFSFISMLKYSYLLT